MKKVFPILIVGIFILSGLGAGALQNNDMENNMKIDLSQTSTLDRDYTHTVFVEVVTATWCSACPASNSAWHNLYEDGEYDFEYVELVYDKNTRAVPRVNQFNPRFVPTSYWDGGEYLYSGTSTPLFKNNLDKSGSRDVPDLVADLEVIWLGDASVEISYVVENNDGSDYPGRLRIYVIELVSTLWNDFSSKPYYHAFLDFAENKNIDISSGGAISDTFVWDGESEGFPGVTEANLQVILAVFDDEGEQSYSDPPSGNPFMAYYSDECIAAIPGQGVNNPPETPTIDGPREGNVGSMVGYRVSSEDPDEDEVYYWIEWGDGEDTGWLGPFESGDEQKFNHAWDSDGDYTIRVKAKDLEDAESPWETFDVTMPRDRTFNSLLQYIFQRFLRLFPLLGNLFI